MMANDFYHFYFSKNLSISVCYILSEKKQLINKETV
jgi:hypothetical protein